MKKTIIALIALTGAAYADDVTFSDPYNGQSFLSGFNAIDISLSKDSYLTPPPNTWNYEETSQAELKTITLILKGNGNNYYSQTAMTTGFGIGIYEKNAVNGETIWTLVGKSEWFSHTSDAYHGSITLDVVGRAVLDTDKTYTLAFHAGSAYFDGLSINSTRTSMSGGVTMAVDATSDKFATLGLHGKAENHSVTMYRDSGNVTDWTPNVKIEVAPIPEPTTATLSLLALAGLAARRRRK